MIADILTVMWKERKGLFRQRGSRTRAVLTMLVPVAMIAIYMPLTMGRDWVDTPWSILACFVIPLLLVGITIPDSIAGERERHTLATLLASRLPDRTILFGKMAIAVAYAWGATIIVLILAVVIVNAANWEGKFLFYSPTTILIDLLFSLVMAILMAALGVLISLRAATVQEATQFLMTSVMFPPLILGFALFLIPSLKPDWWTSIKDALGAVGSTQLILIIVAILVAVCLGLLKVAIGRFQRSRLIPG